MKIEVDTNYSPTPAYLYVSSQQLDIPAANASIGGTHFAKLMGQQAPMSTMVIAGVMGVALFGAPHVVIPALPEFVLESCVADEVEFEDAEIKLSDADWQTLIADDRAPEVNNVMFTFFTTSKTDSQ